MITSRANPKVRLVQGLQTSRRARYREQALVAEGTRLVEDSLAAGLIPRFVLCTADWAESEPGQRLQPTLSRLDVPLLAVADEVMAHCTDTKTPQGVLAVVPFPPNAPPAEPSLVLVIDQLRNPGNLGTVLRTAAAAGVELVLLPPGNVDPYNPKVVRGGMGAHFRLRLLQLNWEATAARLSGLDTWVASAGRGEPYDRVDWTRPAALIVGGEAFGVGAPAEKLAIGHVCIPMPGAMESLNAAVAAGILLFEIVRQRRLLG